MLNFEKKTISEWFQNYFKSRLKVDFVKNNNLTGNSSALSILLLTLYKDNSVLVLFLYNDYFLIFFIFLFFLFFNFYFYIIKILYFF